MTASRTAVPHSVRDGASLNGGERGTTATTEKALEWLVTASPTSLMTGKMAGSECSTDGATTQDEV